MYTSPTLVQLPDAPDADPLPLLNVRVEEIVVRMYALVCF